MQALTEKQAAKIADNKRAFDHNFPGYVVLTSKVYKGPRWFYVVPEDKADDPGNDDIIYYTDSIDNMNGWLYGAVQAACKRVIYNPASY